MGLTFVEGGGRGYAASIRGDWRVSDRVTLEGNLEGEWENDVLAWSSNETFALDTDGDWLVGRESGRPAVDPGEFVAALEGMGLQEPDTALFGADPDDLLEMELLRADFRFRADSIYRARQQRQDSIALAEAGIYDMGLEACSDLETLFLQLTGGDTPTATPPVITERKDPPADSKEWDGKPDKLALLER